MTSEPSASVQSAQATTPSAAPASEQEAIREVLNGYYDAFGRDATALSAFCSEQALVVFPNQLVRLNCRADAASFFDRVATSLRPSGFSHSKMVDCHVRLLNPTTALCSAIAIRMKADGTEMERGGFTYLLHKSDSEWKIHEAIGTDLDKLIAG
jgi:ketosteroid isomerase-like protein